MLSSVTTPRWVSVAGPAQVIADQGSSSNMGLCLESGRLLTQGPSKVFSLVYHAAARQFLVIVVLQLLLLRLTAACYHHVPTVLLMVIADGSCLQGGAQLHTQHGEENQSHWLQCAADPKEHFA